MAPQLWLSSVDVNTVGRLTTRNDEGTVRWEERSDRFETFVPVHYAAYHDAVRGLVLGKA